MTLCPNCETEIGSAQFCSNCGNFLKSRHNKISKIFWVKLLLILLGVYVATSIIHAPTFVVAQGPLVIASDASWENATGTFPEVSEYRLEFLFRDET